MNVIKPPIYISSEEIRSKTSVFLAGSIEMGTAIEWQNIVADALTGLNVNVFSPRRDDWDSSWTQSIDNPMFKSQVTWELDHLTACEIVFFFFDPATKSPISLLELGLTTNQRSNIIVVCPPEFYRKGNVDIVCEYFSIPCFDSLQEGITELKTFIEE